jgi:hypothetical protein
MRAPAPQQLELFTDGARAIAAAKTVTRPLPDESRFQAKLDDARQRLRNLVIIGLRPGLSEEMRASVRKVESWTRSELKVHFRMLEHVRARRRGLR